MRELKQTEIDKMTKCVEIFTAMRNGVEIEFKNNAGEWEGGNGQDLGILLANLHRYRIKPNIEFEAIRKSFVTCNSDGNGRYNVKLETTTLEEAHAVHREILRLRLR